MKIEGHKGRKGADFNARLVKRILDKENFIGDITITAVLMKTVGQTQVP